MCTATPSITASVFRSAARGIDPWLLIFNGFCAVGRAGVFRAPVGAGKTSRYSNRTILCYFFKYRSMFSLVPDHRIYRCVRLASFRITDLSYCFRRAGRSLLPSGLGSSKTLSGGCHLYACGSWYGCIGRCLPDLLASTGGSRPSGLGKSNAICLLLQQNPDFSTCQPVLNSHFSNHYCNLSNFEFSYTSDL